MKRGVKYAFFAKNMQFLFVQNAEIVKKKNHFWVSFIFAILQIQLLCNIYKPKC